MYWGQEGGGGSLETTEGGVEVPQESLVTKALTLQIKELKKQQTLEMHDVAQQRDASVLRAREAEQRCDM